MKAYYFNSDYHLADESPWPFLVSTVTASLFLTLGAVLFFYFFFEINEFSYCVVSFMSLASKAKPKILYLGGSILANQAYNSFNKNYSFRPIGIGKAHWDPTNYSVETQKVILKFKNCLDNNDKESAYDLMYAVLGNKDGIFTKNYGKVTTIINNMIVAYNHDNKDPLTEKEFLNYYGYVYTCYDLNFLDKTNRGTIMSNISEILAPQIVMNEKSNILVERSFYLQEKINLSGQKNPEYTIGLFLSKDKYRSESTIVVYDSDLKITEDLSLDKKYTDFQNLSLTSIDKKFFGMNIVIVACYDNQDSEIIFDKNKIDVLVTELESLAKKYPEHFKNFDKNTFEFQEFLKTGKISYLNKSNFPVVKYYRPNQYHRLPHNSDQFEKSKAYLTVVKNNNNRANINACTHSNETIISEYDNN